MNWKAELINWSIQNGATFPRFVVTSKSSGQSEWAIDVFVIDSEGITYRGHGRHRQKTEAEKNAAQDVLAQLNVSHFFHRDDTDKKNKLEDEIVDLLRSFFGDSEFDQLFLNEMWYKMKQHLLIRNAIQGSHPDQKILPGRRMMQRSNLG